MAASPRTAGPSQRTDEVLREMAGAAERPVLGFGGLLRQLRAEALLTQEDLAGAAKLSPRSVSDLERGVNRTARKDTAELLADALGLAEPVRGLFVAAALGRGPAGDVLAARDGKATGTAHRVARRTRGCPYRGLLPFGESDVEVFYGRERLAAELAAKLAARAAGGGLVVVTGASGSGKSSLLRAGLVPILARGQQVPGSERWARIVMTPTKDPVSELAAVGGVHHGGELGRRDPGRLRAGTSRAGGDRGARGFLRPVRRRSRAGGPAARRPLRRSDDRIRAPGGHHRPGRGCRAAH
jgi:transcriptional regulator with XRE-family HTH domain